MQYLSWLLVSAWENTVLIKLLWIHLSVYPTFVEVSRCSLFSIISLIRVGRAPLEQIHWSRTRYDYHLNSSPLPSSGKKMRKEVALTELSYKLQKYVCWLGLLTRQQNVQLSSFDWKHLNVFKFKMFKKY